VDAATLRTAGLSARKADYVQDLSARFADGRLSTQKLLEANDDELAQMLIEVRGIGRWTVDMFAIFFSPSPRYSPRWRLGYPARVSPLVLAASFTFPHIRPLSKEACRLGFKE